MSPFPFHAGDGVGFVVDNSESAYVAFRRRQPMPRPQRSDEMIRVSVVGSGVAVAIICPLLEK